MLPSFSFKTIDNFDFVPNAYLRILTFDIRLNGTWLLPNTKKWYLDSQFPTQELGFEFW
jgi:hypothetical protein